ncbi:hypothetical protein [Marinobacter subterrani]|uniref:hypothetical protein n=1 Tax=Marinobacter subterrani TaxID=1658765 RepID=UPI002352522E|nr:hypothetical protein [Marinobacter subterrani]
MATPEDGYPISKFTHVEDGFYQVAQSIKSVLEELGATAQNPPTDNTRSSTSPSFVPLVDSGPRSSIRQAVEQQGMNEIHWTMKAEAAEYRESLSISRKQTIEAPVTA